ncbi:hypothetical protein [Microvirga massiliensis]|uniref:hypothetical protein n=1 Tax=Microvirga massiliensis TaxID=1033741 RepID=UPI00062BE0E9|nr:hypothetical protein [Microvirga massiliensis]
MRQRRVDRLKEQAAYQRAYRARLKAERIPTRDDVARVVLHWALIEALKPGQEDNLRKLRRVILARLTQQGFDRAAARRRIDALLDRYEDGWDFQRKPHLLGDDAES